MLVSLCVSSYTFTRIYVQNLLKYKYLQEAYYEKEDYYNNVYTYSGDYEIGDYEFLGNNGIVAKWISKDPEEDKQIRKHLKNDPQSKVEYHNNDVIMAGKRFIIRENFKTMSTLCCYHRVEHNR